MGVFWYQQKKRDAGTGRGAAASRLGLGTGNPIPQKARRMNMHDYANLSEELQSYPVQEGEVVKPREPEHEEVMDSMMQIDVEIAQGNYSAAERRLNPVLGKDKSNVPYRMKLLELYLSICRWHAKTLDNTIVYGAMFKRMCGRKTNRLTQPLARY